MPACPYVLDSLSHSLHTAAVWEPVQDGSDDDHSDSERFRYEPMPLDIDEDLEEHRRQTQPVHVTMRNTAQRGGRQIIMAEEQFTVTRDEYFAVNDLLFQLLDEFVPWDEWGTIRVRAAGPIRGMPADDAIGLVLFDRNQLPHWVTTRHPLLPPYERRHINTLHYAQHALDRLLADDILGIPDDEVPTHEWVIDIENDDYGGFPDFTDELAGAPFEFDDGPYI